MSEVWTKQCCPNCKATNWFHLYDMTSINDPSGMDTTGYECHACKSTIHMIDRETGDYDPHVFGTRADEKDPDDEPDTTETRTYPIPD